MADQKLEAVWAKILRGVRDSKNFSLFGLLGTLNDVEFTDTKIILHTHNEAEKNILKQQLNNLQSMAGDEVTITLQDESTIERNDDRDVIARLKELFGDKVEIV